jgi:hypothetical protein
MNNHNPRWFTPIVNFGVHSAVGTLIFLIVALPAVALDIFVRHLKNAGVSNFTISALSILESGIVLFDCIAVALYIGVSTWREFKGMLE